MSYEPEVLEGNTYQIKPQIGDEHISVYITINDVDGKPHELFLKCKDPYLHQWLVVIGVLVSELFRRVDDPFEVVTLMEEIFDPRGFYMIKNVKYNSVVAHIGTIVRKHIERLE